MSELKENGGLAEEYFHSGLNWIKQDLVLCPLVKLSSFIFRFSFFYLAWCDELFSPPLPYYYTYI